MPFGTQEGKFILFLKKNSFQLDSALFNNSMRLVSRKKGAVVSQLCSSVMSEWQCSLNTENKREKQRGESLKMNKLADMFFTDRPMEQREAYYLSFSSSFCLRKLCLESSQKIFHRVEYKI